MCRPGDLAGGHVSFGDSKSYSWNTRSADQFLKFVRDAALAVISEMGNPERMTKSDAEVPRSRPMSIRPRLETFEKYSTLRALPYPDASQTPATA